MPIRTGKKTHWSESAEAISNLADLLEALTTRPAVNTGAGGGSCLPGLASPNDTAAPTIDSSPIRGTLVTPSMGVRGVAPSPPRAPAPASPTRPGTQQRLAQKPTACLPQKAATTSPTEPVAPQLPIVRPLDSRVLQRPAELLDATPAHYTPERALVFEHNRLAPWEKPSLWRAMRSPEVATCREQVDLPSPTLSAATSNSPSPRRDVESSVARVTTSGNVPGSFFARMIVRAAPQDTVDHRGNQYGVMSRRRVVEAW